MYIFLSEVGLEEEKQYKHYLRINPECFDELFVLAKDNITKLSAIMRDASALKLKLAVETFHVHLFVVLFS